MSQRAAWQLERLGFTDAYDFVAGKSYWIASARPTVRTDGPARVADRLRADVRTSHPEESVQAVRERSDGQDVIVINDHDVVLGVARHSQLSEADPGTTVAEVMRVGPTTIRPDEPVDDLQARMTEKSVSSMIVTLPTGELLGVYDSAGTDPT